MINDWAKKWGVPQVAIDDMRAMLTPSISHEDDNDGALEHVISQQVQLEASVAGARLWRNNNGAAKTAEGYIRFGLANTSSAINKIIKSSDLIGIKPVLITPAHVGKTIGQFLCREIKRRGWKFNPKSEREQAQLRWIQLIASLGGDAAFTDKTGTIK